MDNYSNSSINSQLAGYETPFADEEQMQDGSIQESAPDYSDKFSELLESPFSSTYEAAVEGLAPTSAVAGDYVNLLSELRDDEFEEHLYDMANELEDILNSKVSDETAMGDRYVPFAMQEADQYFRPLLNETTSMIDRVSEYFSGNNFTDQTELEIEKLFEQLEADHSQFSPAQEQFFGKIFNKVKSVVKTGINLAKKGISVVGKIMPLNIVLGKLKKLIKPLLDKVLKFAIGKLPKNLQPHARKLAKKFLNLETTSDISSESNDVPATENLEDLQTELDNHIANLVFSEDNNEAENTVMNYESSSDALQRDNLMEIGGQQIPSLDSARQQFIKELQELPAGASPQPAIERFIPAVIMAARPIIKIAIGLIGRQKVVNFLAGLLANLVSKYIPANVAKPLATSIVDVGMRVIGFETADANSSELGYEAIVNTIQETIQNMEGISEETINDQESLAAEVVESFERAAANNFPSRYIKQNKRLTSGPGTWIMMPRTTKKHLYKKYSHVFDVTLDNRLASSITTFRGLPLSNFLKDKMGLDLSSPVNARVHLYEGIPGTKLYLISRYEKVPGLGMSVPRGQVQFHPLSIQAASLLLKEPKLGRDSHARYTNRRYLTALGQRFYYLEIPGARLKVVSVAKPVSRFMVANRPDRQPNLRYTSVIPNSSDIQGVINFVKSEIRINYFFSEEDAKSIAQKLNAKDYVGAFINVKYSIKSLLNGILIKNVSRKVKIIHEAMPDMYLENFDDNQESYLPNIGRAIGGIALRAGKSILTVLIEKFIEKVTDSAYRMLVNYFKTRANEFINAQSQPQDGVTLKLTWINVPGMAGISSIINGLKGRSTSGILTNVVIPDLPLPEVKIVAGKLFD